MIGAAYTMGEELGLEVCAKTKPARIRPCRNPVPPGSQKDNRSATTMRMCGTARQTSSHHSVLALGRYGSQAHEVAPTRCCTAG